MSKKIGKKELLQIGKHYWLGFVICVVLGGAVGLVISKFAIQPTYQAETWLMVKTNASENGDNLSNQQANVQAISTYKDIVSSEKVLLPVQKALKKHQHLTTHFSQLAQQVTVKSNENSQAFQIQVTTSDRNNATVIANLTASSLTKVVNRAYHDDIDTISRANTVTQVAPRPVINVGLGLVIGALVGLLIGLIRYLMATKRE